MTVPIKGGRPKRFKTPEQLKKEIDGYFQECENKERYPTFAGLAYYLDIDRQTLYNYKDKYGKEYFDVIKKARERIKAEIEQRLMDTTKSKSGVIFLAKNYGYTDRQEIDHKINAEVIIEE